MNSEETIIHKECLIITNEFPFATKPRVISLQRPRIPLTRDSLSSFHDHTEEKTTISLLL